IIPPISLAAYFPKPLPSQRPQLLKGWGLFVVPTLQSQITRSIHLSVPHPLADIDTP
ncbi:hypothetical protein K435DRAFT_922298, partial [Dendrothele bispora CBS 962.96]